MTSITIAGAGHRPDIASGVGKDPARQCQDGRVSRAQLDKRPGDVAAMFDGIAGRYDLLNDVLSAGQDRHWRRAVAAAVAAGPGEVVLDVAAGTGTSSRALTQAGARCVACDFSLGMLRAGLLSGPDLVAGASRAGLLAGRGRGAGLARAGASGAGRGGARVGFVAGDGLALPFRDQSFDAVTVSFGLRNMADPQAGLAEMLRVTKSGGRLVVCEFSHLRSRRLDAAYSRYLAAALPVVARLLSGSGEAYSYLAESIAQWPDQRQLARRIAVAGWGSVRWRNLTMGVVALHRAQRPLAGTAKRGDSGSGAATV
jgi:demethylmenaquinone methyltransferase / 2-methoxy-6-polyprenyl-1,4-benzoquinol methylase